jgi:cytochrome c oxidase assembly protein subunit 11
VCCAPENHERPPAENLEPRADSETHALCTFSATNRSGESLVAQAVPSVTPIAANEHFKKIECFCFTSQEFAANEERALPLQFIVDPELPEYVDTITLSYTLFKTENTYVSSAR